MLQKMKVRIPLVADAEGRWSAGARYGDPKMTEESRGVLGFCYNRHYETMKNPTRLWIEAEVALPEHPYRSVAGTTSED